MNWIDITQKAIKFIEAEIGDSSLSPLLVAKHVHVSESHFTRAFRTLTGFTMSEYIRNRRLCIAGAQLKESDLCVSEVALNVGYESPEAFSKAFKRFHGVNPSESKTATLREFYPLQVKLTLIQVKPLTYRIEKKEKIFLNGSTNIVPSDDSNATAYLWACTHINGYLEKCTRYYKFETLVGVSTSEGYTIKAKCKEGSKDTILTLPPHKWAVFQCEEKGPKGILDTWSQIYTSWIPSVEFEVADLPQLEVYYKDNDGYYCEIWIAIKD